MHSISMTIHVTRYCLKMVSCRWPQCHSFHSCSCNGKYVITHHSISLWIHWIPSTIHCIHQYLKDMFHIPCFQHNPKGRDLVVQDQVRCRLGALESPDDMCYLKTSLPTKWHFHNDCQHDVCINCSHTRDLHASSQTNFPGRLTSHFIGITWHALLPDLVPVPSGLCQKQEHSHHNIYSPCYCLWLIIGVALF